MRHWPSCGWVRRNVAGCVVETRSSHFNERKPRAAFGQPMACCSSSASFIKSMICCVRGVLLSIGSRSAGGGGRWSGCDIHSVIPWYSIGIAKCFSLLCKVLALWKMSMASERPGLDRHCSRWKVFSEEVQRQGQRRSFVDATAEIFPYVIQVEGGYRQILIDALVGKDIVGIESVNQSYEDLWFSRLAQTNPFASEGITSSRSHWYATLSWFPSSQGIACHHWSSTRHRYVGGSAWVCRALM